MSITSYAHDVQVKLLETFSFLVHLLPEGGMSLEAIGQMVAVKATIMLILLALIYAVYWVVRKVVSVLLGRIKIREYRISDETKQMVLSIVRHLWQIASLSAVLSQTGLPNDLNAAVVRSLCLMVFFYYFWMVLKPNLNKQFARHNINHSLRQLINNVSSVFLALAVAGLLLKQFGVDLVSVVAGLGIIGMAVGFAAQSTLADFIAGVTILIEQPFKIGDWVEIDGQEGKVKSISLRTTHIQTRTNVSIIVPNATIASSKMTNLSAHNLAAFMVDFGIAYEEDVRVARDIVIKEVKENHPMVLKSPEPVVRVTALADSGVNLVLVYWVRSTDLDKQVVVKGQLLELIKQRLVEHNIEIPYPHIQLLNNK